MKKIKAGEFEIDSKKIDCFYNLAEDKIVVGDVVAFSIKSQQQMSPPNFKGGKMEVIVNQSFQPVLDTGVIVEIYDNLRIRVLTELGDLIVLNKKYFEDFVRIHKKDSEDALGYLLDIHECLIKMSAGQYAYRLGILSKISKTFRKTIEELIN